MTVNDEDPDLQAILGRRALLLSSALVAIGCSSPQSQDGVAQDGVTTGEVTVPPVPTSTSTATTTTSEARPERFTPFAEAMAEVPPLTVSPGVPAKDKVALDAQAKRFNEVYDKLEKVWRAAPLPCPPAKDVCLTELQEAREALRAIKIPDASPLCGWGDSSNAYIARETAHAAFASGLASKLHAQLTESAAKAGVKEPTAPTGRIMRPCLSCVAPSPRIHSAILFEPESSGLNAAADQVLAEVKSAITSQPRVSFEVRGNTDPKEKGDLQALAKARAAAVIDWLVRNGVPSSQLKALSLGAALPVATSVTPDGRARNRRVELERL